MISHRDKFLEIFNSIDFNKIKDHPNILVAANFWDEDRFCAAKICYKLMRAIDDLIDNHKAKNKLIAPGERIQFIANVFGIEHNLLYMYLVLNTIYWKIVQI